MNHRTTTSPLCRLIERSGAAGLAFAIGLVGAAPSMAQTAVYQAGEKVMVSTTGLTEDRYYQPCTVVRWDAGTKTYRVLCASSEYTVFAAWVRPAEVTPPPAPPAPVPAAPVTPANPVPAAQPADPAGTHQVGQRVMATPTGLKDEKYYRPCTLVEAIAGGWKALCDSPDGGQPKAFTLRNDWINDGAAVPAPKATPPCPFTVPPAAPATRFSAALAKRVLWQQEAELARGRRLGMTFTNFALGAPFRNEKRIFGYQGGAPDGAIIYPLKTRILVCDEHADSVLRWSFDMKYACFRDEIGDWTCPSTASKKLEQIYLPRT